MAFFTLGEIVDIIIMTAVVGFIFSSYFKKPQNHTEEYDPLKQTYSRFFNWEDFKFAAFVTAPAIILHEFGHKFVAMAFGLTATFNAAYNFLLLGVVLKLMNFPFIFFVPAYVSFFGATPVQAILIAFAGPGVNLVLWLGSKYAADKKLVPKKYIPVALLMSKINMFLFIFNLLPIPGFDGFHFFRGIVDTFILR